MMVLLLVVKKVNYLAPITGCPLVLQKDLKLALKLVEEKVVKLVLRKDMQRVDEKVDLRVLIQLVVLLDI